MKIRHILVKHAYEADDILRKLKDGLSFADLAKKYSLCPSSKEGGLLGEIRRGQTVEDFEAAAFALEPGEISEPTRTSFGYHLILREDD